MTTHPRLIEAAWTLMGLWSSIAAVAALHDTERDIQAVRLLPTYYPDGPRALILEQARRSALARLAVQVAFTLVGGCTLLAPRPYLQYNRHLRTFSVLCFIGAELILTWEAVSERSTRQQVNRVIRRRRREKEQGHAVLV